MDGKWTRKIKKNITADPDECCVVVKSTKGYLEQAKIIIGSDTVSPKVTSIKAIEGGLIYIENNINLTDYKVVDNAYIEQPKQSRPLVGKDDTQRFVYQEPPTNANRTILVDHEGEMIDDENPLPVKTKLAGIDPTRQYLNDVVVNDDGSLLMTAYIVEGEPVYEILKNLFSETTLIALTDGYISQYKVPVGKKTLLLEIFVGGGNIAQYSIEVNGNIVSKVDTYFTNFYQNISFKGSGTKDSRGLLLTEGDTLKVKVNNWRQKASDFYSKVLLIEVG